MTIDLRIGDCIQVMQTMLDASIDAIVTDPPYGLEFMGEDWDGADGFRRSLNAADVSRDSPHGRMSRTAPEYRGTVLFQQWCALWAAQALRILKPGGHLVAFGGTRTYHRMVCGVEDAGFEIRDSLDWLYGSGFPKSHNLHDAWEGWGTTLKPAHEPILLARKPLAGTVADNVLRHGTGALNIDASRIAWADEADEAETKDKNRHGDFDSNPPERVAYGADRRRGSELGNYDAPGRWPPNVILDEEAAALLDEQTGTLSRGRWPAAGGTGGISTSGHRGYERDAARQGDLGGASRFFYVAKASTAERQAGLEADPDGNDHPTVKPVELMRWLCRLVTPPRGLILDPFVGSGPTAMAAIDAGFRFIGIDQDPHYVELTRQRVAYRHVLTTDTQAPSPTLPRPRLL